MFDAVIAAGGTAKTYAEDMPEPCALEPVGRYAVKHNPWAYFSSSTSRDNCGRFDVPAGDPENGALRDDVDAGALPTVGLLIPDMCNDGHDCPLSTADDWLRRWLPVIMDGPDYRAGDLAVIVTFDEDDRTADNLVLTTVIAPTVSRVVADDAADPLLAEPVPRRIGRHRSPRGGGDGRIVGHRVRPLTGAYQSGSCQARPMSCRRSNTRL